LSALRLAELCRGLSRKPAFAAMRRSRLEILLQAIVVLPFDDFAAHAISTRRVLVTDNRPDFRDTPDLTVENWVIRP